MITRYSLFDDVEAWRQSSNDAARLRYYRGRMEQPSSNFVLFFFLPDGVPLMALRSCVAFFARFFVVGKWSGRQTDTTSNPPGRPAAS